jgi:DNA repair photolyase
VPGILRAAADAGAQYAAYEILRLPHAVAPLFEKWLGEHFPLKQEKVRNRIRAVRGGKLNDPRFNSRMCGEGIFADQVSKMFHVARQRAGLANEGPGLSTASFRRTEGPQLTLDI